MVQGFSFSLGMVSFFPLLSFYFKSFTFVILKFFLLKKEPPSQLPTFVEMSPIRWPNTFFLQEACMRQLAMQQLQQIKFQQSFPITTTLSCWPRSVLQKEYRMHEDLDALALQRAWHAQTISLLNAVFKKYRSIFILFFFEFGSNSQSR